MHLVFAKKASERHRYVALSGVAKDQLSFIFGHNNAIKIYFDVHYSAVNYSESKRLMDDYGMIEVKNSKIESVLEEFERVNSDLRILLVYSKDDFFCGYSSSIPADLDSNFSVINVNCAVNNYTIAHEIGHLLGANHERPIDLNDNIGTAFAYYNNTKEWGTIMTLNTLEKCAKSGCRRIPFFSDSNRTISYRGDRIGDINTNNVNAIIRNKERVSKLND